MPGAPKELVFRARAERAERLSEKHRWLARQLICAGADVHRRNKEGRRPIDATWIEGSMKGGLQGGMPLRGPSRTSGRIEGL